MRVRFLGSGDAFGSGGRLQACVLIEWNGHRALLDCGTSVLPSLRRFDVDPNSLDAVLVSHFHGDHFGGVAFLLLDAYYGGRTKPLAIAGPPGIAERATELSTALFRGFTPRRLRYDLRYVDLPEREEVAIGPLGVTAFEVPHVIDVVPRALRVRCGGRVVAYSGDAAWSPALAEAARGADLFICEASTFETENPSHVSYRTLMSHRAELDCGRIVLTHLGAETLARRAEVELECADDGTEIAL